MKKGSTPTIEITIPLLKSSIQKARVIFGYGSVPFLKKNTDNLEISDNLIKCSLSQEETFMFDSDSIADVQLRIITTDNKSLVSDKLKLLVEECMDDEVL